MSKLDNLMMNPTNGSLIRKIKVAFIIDTERFIFYLLPFILLIIYDINSTRKYISQYDGSVY